jgi:Protein of unknown function (DUF1566)/Collagen triple helix repeat (20 copies)
MNGLRSLVAGWVALVGLTSGPTQAAGLPLVISATVDYTHATLTIKGQNCGSNPSVSVNSLPFPTISAASNEVVANFPAGMPPPSFAPGTYFLTVQSNHQLPAVFAVVIGANGPPGPQGIQGLPGAYGATGATGAMGPAGTAGAQGPAGPQGVAGPLGATGSTGPQGPQGATGAPGQQGPIGLTGTAGKDGTGVPTCTAPNIYLVLINGALACQPRYVDNGDLTVTDNQTALMWEKKFDQSVPIICSIGDLSCPPDAHHEVHNAYTWSATGTAADGTLFTGFLASLNLDQSVNGSATCFANHCDWRIPNIVELQTIVELSAPGCFSPPLACIDPAFGPTEAEIYWSSSSSSLAGGSNFAKYVDFSDAFVGGAGKTGSSYARAVRGGR